MNLTVHPSHWLHHHRPDAAMGKGDWHQELHRDICWIFTITLAVLAISMALAFLLVKLLPVPPLYPQYYP